MDIRLNEITHDIELVNADLGFVTKNEAVTQFLRQRLKFFETEWFLDETKGIPYFDQILIKGPRASVIDAIFKREILETNGVVELKSFSLDLDPAARALTLSFKARSTDGDIDFSEPVGVV